GCACNLGRWRHPAGGIGRLGPALSALPARRLAGGGGDGRLATALGSVVASSGLCPRTAVGSARWLQAAGGSATGGRLDDAERTRDRRGRADGEGGDPGTEPRAASAAGVGGSMDRAGVSARRWADAGGGRSAVGPA